MSQILINHDNAILCPPQRARSIAQGVLASRTFGVLQDLLQGALANVQTCETAEMLGGHVLYHITALASP